MPRSTRNRPEFKQPKEIPIRDVLARPGGAEAVLLAVKRQQCMNSLAEFAKEAWHVIEPGRQLKWNWHLDVLCAYVQAWFEGRIKRLDFNVSPGSMKSLIWTVFGASWWWAHDPTQRMIAITNEITLATSQARKVREIIESEWYQNYWPNVQLASDQAEKTNFATTKTGFYQCLGVGSNISGKRGDRVWTDDAVDANKAFSDVVIEAANQYVDQALSTRVNDPVESCIGNIMQRLRTNDLSAHYASKKHMKWVRVSIAMEYEGTPGYDPVKDLGPEYAHLADPRTKIGEPMFPAFFTPDVLASYRENLGEYGWAGQMQQRPTPLSGGILKSPWWRVWPDDRPLPRILHTFASWDTAFSERDVESAAYSACTVWGVWLDETDVPRDYDPKSKLPAGRHKLLLIRRWYGRVDYDDLLDAAREIEKAKLTKESDAHLIEKKASGQSMLQSLRRRCKVRIIAYDPRVDGGGDKVARAYNASRAFNYRVVETVRGPDGRLTKEEGKRTDGLVYIPNKPWALEVRDKVAEFPMTDALGKDVTDTVTQAVNYLQRGWWIQAPSEEAPAITGYDLGVASEDDEEADPRAIVATLSRGRRVSIYG